MKAPAFAGSVDNVERLGVLKIQMLDLPLKRVGRVGREQFALDGAEDRKSGPSERVLDFTARVRFHVVLHLIAAERIGFYPSCAAGARSGALRMSVSAPRAISSITSCMTDKTSWTKPRRASASPSLYMGILSGYVPNLEAPLWRGWPAAHDEAWLPMRGSRSQTTSEPAPEAQALTLDSAGIPNHGVQSPV